MIYINNDTKCTNLWPEYYHSGKGFQNVMPANARIQMPL